MALLFGIVGVYNLVKNRNGNGCNAYRSHADWPRYGDIIQGLCLANREDNDSSLKLSSILNLAFVVVGILASLGYRRVQAKTAEEVDRGAVTTADYTVIVENIPKTESSKDIKEFFEQHGGKREQIHVKKIVLAYDIGTYISLVRRKTILMQKREKARVKDAIETELAKIQDKLKVYEDEFAGKSSHRFTGIVFITFASEAGKLIVSTCTNSCL